LPRVDAGWIVVDTSRLMEMERGELEELARKAVEEKAVLVTRPGIVTVRVDYRSVRLSVGPGTLIFPPGSSIEGVPLARPEWVDGCVPPGVYEVARGEGPLFEVEGVLVAREYNDPVALAGNGVRGVFSYRRCGGIGILFLGDDPVASYVGEGYCVGLEGRLGDFLAFIASLYTGCRGR